MAIRGNGARLAVAGVVLLLAAACGAQTPSGIATSSAPDPRGILLPASSVAWPPPPATPPACAGVGLDAVLHGDPGDSSIAWLVDRSQGERIEVRWPPGFRARFSPALVVIDISGQEVAREGDAIDGGCAEGDRIVLGYP